MNIIKKLLARILNFFKKSGKVAMNVVPSILDSKVEVVVGKLLRVTSGKRHGWFESNVGVIRKPLSAVSQ